eukprot:6884629-Ditylum_brightwellii.AAC.1
MHNWLNIGQQKQKVYKDAVAVCPICQANNETWQHMFQFDHDNSKMIQTFALIQFKSDLLKMKTAIEEQDIIDWDNFVKGRAASSWMEAQRQYVLAVDWSHKERDGNQDQ